jgi:hypothetical protein
MQVTSSEKLTPKSASMISQQAMKAEYTVHKMDNEDSNAETGKRKRRLAMNRITARERNRRKRQYIANLQIKENAIKVVNHERAQENEQLKAQIESIKSTMSTDRPSAINLQQLSSHSTSTNLSSHSTSTTTPEPTSTILSLVNQINLPSAYDSSASMRASNRPAPTDTASILEALMRRR